MCVVFFVFFFLGGGVIHFVIYLFYLLMLLFLLYFISFSLFTSLSFILLVYRISMLLQSTSISIFGAGHFIKALGAVSLKMFGV